MNFQGVFPSLTTSGITGFTLQAMVGDPACTGGSLISWNPQRGSEDKSVRSLQIFESFTSIRFRTY